MIEGSIQTPSVQEIVIRPRSGPLLDRRCMALRRVHEFLWAPPTPVFKISDGVAAICRSTASICPPTGEAL